MGWEMEFGCQRSITIVNDKVVAKHLAASKQFSVLSNTYLFNLGSTDTTFSKTEYISYPSYHYRKQRN
jgi:hypothetical protein